MLFRSEELQQIVAAGKQLKTAGNAEDPKAAEQAAQNIDRVVKESRLRRGRRLNEFTLFKKGV